MYHSHICRILVGWKWWPWHKYTNTVVSKNRHTPYMIAKGGGACPIVLLIFDKLIWGCIWLSFARWSPLQPQKSSNQLWVVQRRVFKHFCLPPAISILSPGTAYPLKPRHWCKMNYLHLKQKVGAIWNEWKSQYATIQHFGTGKWHKHLFMTTIETESMSLTSMTES